MKYSRILKGSSITILTVCLLSFSQLSLIAQQIPERRNIGLFFDKLRAGKQVTVAWLGGSITCGNGASDVNKTSFRALTTNWLRTHYPQINIRELNASVPSTGSLYGAMRARRDVVEHKPDLVFIEFSANDVSDPETEVKESLEGVIRQLLAVPQPPEIVLVHLGGGSRQKAIEWHEAIGRHYQIPSIILPDPGNDSLQYNDEGQKSMADKLTAFLGDQEKETSSASIKILPPPMLSDEMTYGELKAFAELSFQSAWHTDSNKDRALPSKLLVSDKAGAVVSANFEGTSVGLTYRMGPDCGMIECLIDDKLAPEPLTRIDTYNPATKIGARVISGLSQGEHTIIIRVRSDKNPKSSSTQVRLGNLLVGGQRPERL